MTEANGDIYDVIEITNNSKLIASVSADTANVVNGVGAMA